MTEPFVETEDISVTETVDRPKARRGKANGQAASRFQLIAFDQVTVSTAPASLVQGLLPRAGVVVVWGPPKCGKSFWVFDVLMHVALDWLYRERRVEHGVVVYISLEGNRALPRRVEAFRQHHDVRKAPLYLIIDSLNLPVQHQQLIADIKSQLGATKPVAVTIDTLNQSLPGSESKDADMAVYLRAATEIARVFDCLVIIVHHCGHDATRARGHSSLYGNSDAVIAVSRDVADNVVASVEFMKDDEAGAEIVSRLKVIEIGTDDNGDPLTSCVIEPVESKAKAGKRIKLPDQAALALRALNEVLADVGTIPPCSNHIPPNTRTCSMSEWASGCRTRVLLTDSPSSDSQYKAFVRASDKLQVLGLIGIWQDQVWVVGHAGHDPDMSGNVRGTNHSDRHGHTPLKGVRDVRCPDSPPLSSPKARKKKPRFRILGPAPGAACLKCYMADDTVMRVSPGGGQKSETLHPECAEAWFAGLDTPTDKG